MGPAGSEREEGWRGRLNQVNSEWPGWIRCEPHDHGWTVTMEWADRTSPIVHAIPAVDFELNGPDEVGRSDHPISHAMWAVDP